MNKTVNWYIEYLFEYLIFYSPNHSVTENKLIIIIDSQPDKNIPF